MKKLVIAGTIIGVILLIGAGTLVNANEYPSEKQQAFKRTTPNNDQGLTDTSLPIPLNGSKIKFRGIWGYDGSNETQGYVGGFVTKREKSVVLKGRWNTSDNTTKEKLVVILRNGYFHGRIIIGNETAYRIVGLYRYDQENHLLHLRWMTAQKTGWAHCRIVSN